MSFLDQYQQFCKTTATYKDANTGNLQELLYLSSGLAGEAGEVCNKIKKIYRDNLDKSEMEVRAKIISELGDVLWYMAMIANSLDTTLTRCLVDNRDKLTDRFNRSVIGGDGDAR